MMETLVCTSDPVQDTRPTSSGLLLPNVDGKVNLLFFKHFIKFRVKLAVFNVRGPQVGNRWSTVLFASVAHHDGGQKW